MFGFPRVALCGALVTMLAVVSAWFPERGTKACGKWLMEENEGKEFSPGDDVRI